jgi:hypothetical protein
MRETGIVLMIARPARPPAYRGHRTRASGVEACATCKGNRDVGKLGLHAGFCHDCLDRSRIVDADDIGGEC